MNHPIVSAANRAIHNRAFEKALTEELSRVPVPGLSNPAPVPTEPDPLGGLTLEEFLGDTEPLTYNLGAVFSFITATTNGEGGEA